MKAPGRRICFVCTGNLCRSPFADRWLAAQARQQGLDHVVVTSAGTLQLQAMAPPVNVCEAAQQHGIDLQDHRPRHANRGNLLDQHVVVGMAQEHVRFLRVEYPQLKDSIYLFSRFPRLDVDGEDIPDPMGLDNDAAVDCYQKIVDGMKPFLAWLTAR